MRIVYLHQYFRTPDMGGGTRSYEMARRLVAWGHEVDMITSETDLDPKRQRGWRVTDEAGIRVHWLAVPYDNRMGYLGRLWAFFRFAAASAIRATRLASDVVFASSTPLTIALPALVASRLRGVPMVFEVRDLWPEVPVALGALRNPLAIAAARLLELAAYRGASRVVALSPGMADGVAARGVSRNRIALIPNACDLELFGPDEAAAAALRAQLAWLGPRPLVVYTGTLGQVNGVGYLVRLAVEVRAMNPEVRFAIIGDGREREQLLALASELGVLGETLFWLPPVAKGEIVRWLAAADVATSTVIDVEALWHNSANKVFDALASGTPVVINHRGWQAELLGEADAGFALPATDLAEAAHLLLAALGDENWRRRAGANARALAEERFSRELLTRRFEEVLVTAVKVRREDDVGGPEHG